MADRGLGSAHLGSLSEPCSGDHSCQFPFRIQGFHTDNGSEFINRNVADLLNKLLIEQTKVAPGRDNGLEESKNGAVFRKHVGYGYIDAGHADRINGFYREILNPI